MSEHAFKALRASYVSTLRARNPGTGTLDAPFVIPPEDGFTAIGSDAFKNWHYPLLESVVIPVGVTTIEDAAFIGCSGLVSVLIPDTVTSIGASAFSGCSRLESIVIPEGIDRIVRGTFSGCASLESVVIPDAVTSIGVHAFNDCVSLTSVVIPDGVTSIGAEAFSHCTRLESIVIPEGVTTIRARTFRLCQRLESVVIPNTVTIIEEAAFTYCTRLVSVVVPEGVKRIEKNAFLSCTGLVAVTLPFTLEDIGPDVFAHCGSLRLIAVPLRESLRESLRENLSRFISDSAVIVYKNRDGSTRYTRNLLQRRVNGGMIFYRKAPDPRENPLQAARVDAATAIVGLPDPVPLLRAISDPSPGGTQWEASMAFVGSLRRRPDLPRLPDEMLLIILEQFVYGDDRLLRQLIERVKGSRAAARAIAPAGNLYDWTAGVSAN